MTIHTKQSPFKPGGVKPPSASRGRLPPPRPKPPRRPTHFTKHRHQPAKVRKIQRARDTVFFASWNAQGKLMERAQMEVFSADMRSRNISVCAIQETRTALNAEVNLENGDKFVFFGLQANGFGGLGYYIAAGWTEHFQTTKKVTDRIVVARFRRILPDPDPGSVLASFDRPADTTPRTRDPTSLTQLEKFFRPTVICRNPNPPPLWRPCPGSQQRRHCDNQYLRTYGGKSEVASENSLRIL